MKRFVALLAMGVSGCAGSPPPAGLAEILPGQDSVSVIDRGWHTDVALSAEGLSGPAGALRQTFPGVRTLVFGFGDRAFFMTPDETLPDTLAALFPGPGVILVTALAAPPAKAFGADHVVTLGISPGQRARIAAFIENSLTINPDGSLDRLGDGPYPGSLFFAATRTYDAFHDCNRWTVSALQSGGLPVDADGVFFAGQVLGQARRIAAGRNVRTQWIDPEHPADPGRPEP